MIYLTITEVFVKYTLKKLRKHTIFKLARYFFGGLYLDFSEVVTNSKDGKNLGLTKQAKTGWRKN